MIYQVDGSSGDILPQQYKMSLKDFKTRIQAHVPLHGKVRKSMNLSKRKDFDHQMQADQPT